jgi:DNA polymerase-3 subunit epsilon
LTALKRQIILDTETTGLSPDHGHRIIEIGCIELIERRPTGKTFHYYLNPERPVDEGAYKVHGLSNEFLSDKPLFKSISDELINFLKSSELIIHNAAFDVGFINAELKKISAKFKLQDICEITDTLEIARNKHPGQKNNLDALCKRYQIDSSDRLFHGALLDAQLLADVYLAMTSGQKKMDFSDSVLSSSSVSKEELLKSISPVIYANTEELDAHANLLAIIKKQANDILWERYNAQEEQIHENN